MYVPKASNVTCFLLNPKNNIFNHSINNNTTTLHWYNNNTLTTTLQHYNSTTLQLYNIKTQQHYNTTRQKNYKTTTLQIEAYNTTSRSLRH